MSRRVEMVLLVVLLLVMSLGFAGAQLFPRQGVYPDLSDLKSFRVYVEGRHQSFGADDKLEKSSIDKSWRNGDGPTFSIKGIGIRGDEPIGKATMIGNLGTEECDFIRFREALLIIETTPVGSQHFLIIYNDWSKAEMGFRCVYVRHHHPTDMTSIGGGSTGSMLGTLTGVAKPL